MLYIYVNNICFFRAQKRETHEVREGPTYEPNYLTGKFVLWYKTEIIYLVKSHT